jgi:hypothetical protein
VKKNSDPGSLDGDIARLPGYYRNRPAVDRIAMGIWGSVEGVWLHFAYESKKLGNVVSGVVSGKASAKSIPSQRAAEVEAVKESQKQIDEQEQKEATGEAGGADMIDKLRQSDPSYPEHVAAEAATGNGVESTKRKSPK